MRRFSSLIWNNQTALLVPCLAQKQATARPRMTRQQTLACHAPQYSAGLNHMRHVFMRSFRLGAVYPDVFG
ncbi:hypothetical protein, partial [Pseudomonas sp. SJZ079]|uniref:hypothetical protein n=1 Tax=Pseudomonas sp. SJZ079 TaxID=2572887 RepID=UPI001C499D51